jgi:transcriptional regulator with GAF, ATPase, and Fis domain
MAYETGDGDGGSRATTLALSAEMLRGPWRLKVGGPSSPRAVTLAHGQSVTLGGSPGCSVVIDDPTVSGRHVSVTAQAAGIVVEDLGSKNGVFVGGARVEKASLRGDYAQFVIGRTTVSLEPADQAPDSSATPALPGLIGSSGPMRRLAAEVRRVAVLAAPVLLLGESGTGKDVVARAIHTLSARRGRYVPLNAGALGEALADSELFGHCRGAFTGAVQARSGAFEQADRGTLFLDEVADLAPAIQAKLLRTIEDGEVRQLGGVAPIKVHTRLVAATWAPIEQRVDAGSFRADLYHRISTFVIRVPALRQRKSDIPALVRALLASRVDELGERHLSPAALERLSTYTFPGNVRELFSIVYRAAALSNDREISAADVEASFPSVFAGQAKTTRMDARQLLDVHGGNVSAAARSARVARSTFRSWLRSQQQASATGVTQLSPSGVD